MGWTYKECKDCADRKIEPVNCHSYCEKYLEAKEENRKIGTARWKDGIGKVHTHQTKRHLMSYIKARQRNIRRTK